MSEFLYLRCPDVKNDDFLRFQRFSKTSTKLCSPTAALSKRSIFANLTLLHILHANEWIFIFEMSWCQKMMIFFIFKGFPKHQQNWSFRPPWPCQKGHYLLTKLLQILHANEWIFIFDMSWCQKVMILFNCKGFPKYHKNWSFRPPQPCRKGQCLLISHFSSFCIQMSEFLYLRCPDVKKWWFSSFSNALWKKKRFRPVWPCRKGQIFLISHFCTFCI